MSTEQQPTTLAPDGLTLQRYGRFWAVYDQGTLVVVTVYRKGALEVMKRLASQQSHQTIEEIHDGRPQT
jgi:hypothetical protein